MLASTYTEKLFTGRHCDEHDKYANNIRRQYTFDTTRIFVNFSLEDIHKNFRYHFSRQENLASSTCFWQQSNFRAIHCFLLLEFGILKGHGSEVSRIFCMFLKKIEQNFQLFFFLLFKKATIPIKHSVRQRNGVKADEA